MFFTLQAPPLFPHPINNVNPGCIAAYLSPSKTLHNLAEICARTRLQPTILYLAHYIQAETAGSLAPPQQTGTQGGNQELFLGPSTGPEFQNVCLINLEEPLLTTMPHSDF